MIMMSEGWRLPPRDDGLTRVVDGQVPGREPVDVSSGRPADDGAARRAVPIRNRASASGCGWRPRISSRTSARCCSAPTAPTSASTPVDPRGLVVFDEDLSLAPRHEHHGRSRAPRARGRTRLRELAENTDGIAVLNTNNIDAAMKRMLADIDSYYLLGYYSTNTKLDGRFRKLTVRVKRPGVDVRARPGYLAPTEAEVASARVDRLMNGAAPGPATRRRNCGARSTAWRRRAAIVPMRVQTAGGRRADLAHRRDRCGHPEERRMGAGRARAPGRRARARRRGARSTRRSRSRRASGRSARTRAADAPAGPLRHSRVALPEGRRRCRSRPPPTSSCRPKRR